MKECRFVLVGPTCLLLSLLCRNVETFALKHPQKRVKVQSKEHVGPSRSSTVTRLASAQTDIDIFVGECIGRGSYGVVHYVEHPSIGGTKVGKRALTRDEMILAQNGNAATEQGRRAKEQRCKYYWGVEKHCFQKLMTGPVITTCIPHYVDSYIDKDGRSWMIFDVIPEAVTLDELMLRDQADHRLHNEHHLYLTSQALGLVDSSLASTLDVVISNLLESIAFVHSHSIVHRDIKPGNVLVSSKLKRLVLIDFGSAADLSTAGVLKGNIGLSNDRVAVSPIYAAPEVFVEPSRFQEALKFDCFSVGLLISQLLFQYLEERTESGFRQQLEKAQWDLDAWLQGALQSKVRPIGIADALQVLQDRPGLWRLIQDLLREDPAERITARGALERWKRITANQQNGDASFFDGTYLQSVFATMESCEIPTVRSIRFVATFKRNRSLGLYLAEAHSEEINLNESDMVQWRHATADASEGDVFVLGTVPLGQAEEMGIFEVGDRLNGIGELPFKSEGFERALTMLADQPKSSKTVTLHFDRKPIAQRSNNPDLPLSPLLRSTRVTDQGAWSIQGRRTAQEDAYVLTEITDSKKRSIVLSAVFDGHLGNAASSFLCEEFPSVVAKLLNGEKGNNIAVENLVEEAWNECCELYRASCLSGEDCSATYDEREGVLMAYTGGKDAVAGSTGIVVAVDQQATQVAIANCGDSKAVVIDKQGIIRFETVDHSLENELDRLVQGKQQGLDYGIPKCVGKWRLEVGDYDYAVARSLEGPYATLKGIISKADVTLVPIQESCTILLASDGLWEVLDPALIGRFVAEHRKEGFSASQTTAKVITKAYENGSIDNISVIILYID